MAIELTEWSRGKEAKQHQFEGNVVHFGSSPPPGKDAIPVTGRGVAPHHAKLFFSQGQFWLLDLSGQLCVVLKNSGRAAFLTINDSIIELERGEAFQIGEAVFVVTCLTSAKRTPPHDSPRLTPSPSDSRKLLAKYREITDVDALTASGDLQVVYTLSTLLHFSAELNQYIGPDEMWRRTADRLLGLFAERWADAKLRLLLVAGRVTATEDGQPERVVAWHQPDTKNLSGTTSTADELLAQLGAPTAILDAAHDMATYLEKAVTAKLPEEMTGTLPTFLLTTLVTKEEVPVGTITVLGQAEQAGDDILNHNDIFLFAHVASSLSLALTLLSQRRRVEESARFHDLGHAVAATLHDEGHLFDRAQQYVDSIFGLADDKVVSVEEVETSLVPRLRRISTMLRQARALARTRVRFVRGVAKRSGVEFFRDCNPAVRQWFEELPWFLAEDCVEIRHDFRLGNEPFLAGVDGVLASLRNLVVNAEKSLRQSETEPWRLALRAEFRVLGTREFAEDDRQAGYVVLSVGDTGIGIPPHLRRDVFCNRILDSDSAHGLGTQIVRWVLDEHKGLIRHVSRDDAGTLVELWFPRLAAQEVEAINAQWNLFQSIRERVGPVGILPPAEFESFWNDQSGPSGLKERN